MQFAADKVVEAGNKNVMLTERGTTFGYQDLVVDYRGIPEMQSFPAAAQPDQWSNRWNAATDRDCS